MVSLFKSLQGVFTSILSDIPEGLRVVLDFLWKCRWFIVAYVLLAALYGMVMKVLPFLMWTYVIKSIFSFL